MYKYNPFIMQNIRANTLIIGANNNPINKKVRLNADFSINYTRLFHLSFELGVPFPYPCQCGMGGNTIIGNQCVTNISNLNFSHF